MSIHAIETSYKGYRFRSRLEARWAVFFDELGLRWEYEKEGFHGPAGRFLPDFYLTDWKLFIEIKPEIPQSAFTEGIISPDPHRKNDLMNAMFVNGEFVTGNTHYEKMFVFYGTPGVPRIQWEDNGAWKLTDGSIGFSPQVVDGGNFIANAYAFAMVAGEKDLDVWHFYDTDCGEYKGYRLRKVPALPSGYTPALYLGNGISYDHELLGRAYKKARSARFEYGERG